MEPITVLAVAVIALALLMAGIIGWKLWSGRTVDRETLAARIAEKGQDVWEDRDWITVDLIPQNRFSRPGIVLRQINGVVVHYVGNPGTTAEQNRSYFASLADTGAGFASSHFVIGMDGTVVQCVPLSEMAYCSNDRNSDTIAIECCHPDESGQFTQETYDALVRLVKELVDTYHLEQGEVIRHYDVTGKQCPRYFVTNEDAWEQFQRDIFE